MNRQVNYVHKLGVRSRAIHCASMFMVVGTLRVPSILCFKVYGTRSVPTTMQSKMNLLPLKFI